MNISETSIHYANPENGPDTFQFKTLLVKKPNKPTTPKPINKPTYKPIRKLTTVPTITSYDMVNIIENKDSDNFIENTPKKILREGKLLPLLAMLADHGYTDTHFVKDTSNRKIRKCSVHSFIANFFSSTDIYKS